MAEIFLSKGKICRVDDADSDWLSQWKWHALHGRCGNFYATRGQRLTRGVITKFLMHREILGLAHGDKRQVDHKNGDGLDNRRDNLRIASLQKNAFNRRFSRKGKSTLVGVFWNKHKGRWTAQVKINGKRAWVRTFRTQEEAIYARREAAKIHFGEFAPK